MNIFDGCGSNSVLWILILLLVLGNGNSNGIFSGCSLPILLALLYCLYKNGTLAALATPSDGGCGCGCNH